MRISRPSDRRRGCPGSSPPPRLAPFLILAAALLPWGGGANAQQPGPGQPGGVSEPSVPQLPAGDEDAIRNVLKDQEAAWNKHDMKAFTKAFREDAEGINVAGMYWRGRAAVLQHLTAYHETFLKNVQEYLADVQVHPVGDGYAVAVSIWKVDGFKSASGDIPPSRHRSTVLLAKGADGWKVVHFHNTTIGEAAVGGAAPAGAK